MKLSLIIGSQLSFFFNYENKKNIPCRWISQRSLPFISTVLNISTSAQLAFKMKLDFSPPAFDPSATVDYFPYFNGSYLAVAASLTGGNVLHGFVKLLQQWTHQLGKFSLDKAYFLKLFCSTLLLNKDTLIDVYK